MANKVYPPGAGDVIINLGDQEVILKPTLAAGLSISRSAGGIRGAIDKVMNLDLDMIMSVIRVGVGPREAKKLNGLEELIWQQGLTDSQGEILAKCVEFLTNLARGGRPAEEAEEDQESGEPPKRTPRPAPQP
jgi:hypothetical protein